ncbi:MAG: parallel beta-helix repeat-containing protein [Candidatus Peregrinibacteria bacterium Greene0416_19]|nr:MAG: parallel beta-helix repeat-containing protein [Candidatus Peregrinibacteria bacterium Greene0416_19]
MRRSISIALLTLLPASAAFAAFPDVPSEYPYAEGIAYVQEQNIVSGYPDGTYLPNRMVNRAEFTKIIIASRYAKPAIDACLRQHPDALRFRDVPVGSWYAPFLCMAVTGKIIGGYPDGTFRGAGTINFAEAAKIFAGGFALRTDDSLGTVYGESVWYRPSTMKLAQMDAIPSTVDRNDHPVTRGEMAEMIYRLQTGQKSTPSESSRTVSDPAGFSFTYPADIFLVVPSSDTVAVGADVSKERKVNGIRLVHAAPVEHCDLSGLPEHCTPLTRDSTIGFFVVPEFYSVLKNLAQPWQRETEMQVGGVTGFTFTSGAEGEGNVYIFLPLTDRSTLMIVRSFISEDTNLAYKGVSGFLPIAEQEKVSKQVLDSLTLQSAPAGATTQVKLFFFSEKDRKEATYQASFPVTRTTPKSERIADAALRLLFAGPTTDEQNQGARTMPELSALASPYISVSVKDGTAYVNFHKEALEHLNAVAGIQHMVKAPIEATLKQFPTIKQVQYAIDGKVYTEWGA